VNNRKCDQQPSRANGNSGDGHNFDEREKAGSFSLSLKVPFGQVPLEVHFFYLL
jgi:hypothetical protein